MRILIVDDDRFLYSELLIWQLQCEDHEVVYCQNIREVKFGWFEITTDSIQQMRETDISERVIRKVKLLLMKRFENDELFENELGRILDAEEFDAYCAELTKFARQNAWEPKPDCILLDMMMPGGPFYDMAETNDGKETGLRILRDKHLSEKIKDIPVIVVTINDDDSLRTTLTQEFREVVKEIIYKKDMSLNQIVIRLKQGFP